MQQAETTRERSLFQTRQQETDERYIENQKFEEKTDIGERLGYHIDTQLHYVMRGGAAYCLTDTKHRPFHEQTEEAMETGRWKFTRENAFEAERLRLEHEEALLVDAFGRGELEGNLLIKVSKVPDAVVAGTASVDGYRRDLMRSFVRLYYRTSRGTVSCRLFSLDGNSEGGFREIEQVIRMRIVGRASEDVLGDAALLNWQTDDMETQVELLAETIKALYDEGLFAETSRKTYAGSEFIDRTNTMQVIDKHTDLFSEHWRAISEVQGRALSSKDKETFIEDMRRRTAAAIKLRENGNAVSSIGDASVAREALTGEYGRECATNGMNQTEQHAEMGKEVDMTCPFCGLPTRGDPCAAVLECTQCGARVEHGKVVSEGIGRAAALKVLSENYLVQNDEYRPFEIFTGKRATDAEQRARRLYGERAMLVSRVVIGDKLTHVVDRFTGEMIATNVRKEDLVLAA